MSKVMAVSQTDSRHRILSTRDCVAAPICSRSPFLSDWLLIGFPTLVPLHLSTPTGRWTFSVSWCYLVALNTKASLSQEKQYMQATRTFSHNDSPHNDDPPGLQNPLNQTWKEWTCTPSNLRLRPTMPTIVCLGPEWMSCWTAAAQCSMDSSYTAGGYNCSIYCKMAGVMTPETWYSHTELLWYLWGVESTVHCLYRCSIFGLIC